MTAPVDQHVDAICESLRDLSPPSIVMFSEALRLAGGPLSSFAAPVRRWAGDRAAGDAVPNPLTRISMRQAITKAAAEGSLLTRLGDAQEPFGRALADALVAVAADRLPAPA